MAVEGHDDLVIGGFGATKRPKRVCVTGVDGVSVAGEKVGTKVPIIYLIKDDPNFFPQFACMLSASCNQFSKNGREYNWHSSSSSWASRTLKEAMNQFNCTYICLVSPPYRSTCKKRFLGRVFSRCNRCYRWTSSNLLFLGFPLRFHLSK